MAWLREEVSGTTTSLVIAVHAQPGAKRTEVAGEHGDALKIRLAAPAIEGRANAELRRFLADQFGVALQSVRLLQGETGRRKLVSIATPMRRPAWVAGAVPRASG